MRSRERLRVTGVDPIGLYTLLRVERGGLDPGRPGQFFMLSPPGRVLPRPMSLCLAPPGELAFLIDPIGPGTRALCGLEPGDRLDAFGPLGNGFDLDVDRPLLVGGGIGIAPLVTSCCLEGFDVLACGPEPMLDAVAGLSPGAQLAWEAPMACGYGACFGCAVEIGGQWKRLCVEGPVLAA